MMQRLGFATVLTAVLLDACYTDTTDYLACTELQAANSVNVDVGGSVASKTALDALMQFAGVAGTTSLELTSLCAQIASDLGTPQPPISAALTATNQDARLTAVCRLATDALGHGHAPIALTPVTCTPVPQFSCLNACMPATSACRDACDAAAGAKANCPEPTTVTVEFAPILAMRARLAIMAASADSLSAAVASITDIKSACIPYARDRVHDANAHVAAAQKAIDALIIAAGGS